MSFNPSSFPPSVADRIPRSVGGSVDSSGGTPERVKTSSVSSPLSGDETDPGGGIDGVEESDTDIGSDDEEPEVLEGVEEEVRKTFHRLVVNF